MANDYKILCSEANNMVKMKNGSVTSNGWTKIDGEYDKRTNFKGVLYEKDSEYALCFVGINGIIKTMPQTCKWPQPVIANKYVRQKNLQIKC